MDTERNITNSPFFMKRTWALTIWRWVFNLSILAGFLAIILNRFNLRIRIYLAGDSSLLNHFVLLVTAVILILFLTSTIHELGHLFAGRIAHLKFQLLVVGPLRIARGKSGYSLGWQHGNAMFNGLVASIPEEPNNLRYRMLLFAAGGPVASFLLMFLTALVAFILNKNAVVLRDYFWIWECATFTAVVSYFFFLTSMKPGSYQNGLPADGSRIFMLLRNEAEAERWCALVILNSTDIQGFRPFEWDQSLLQRAPHLDDNSYDNLMLQMMQYQVAIDKGQPGQALTILERLIKLPIAWESGVRASLALEMAYCYGRYQNDAQQAKDWLNQVKHNRSQQAIQLRAETAVLYAQNRSEETIQMAQKTIRQLETQPVTGVTLAEKSWMEEIIQLTVENNLP